MMARLPVDDERGFTLVELITVMAMLAVVVTALSSVLVAATEAEEDMNRRFGSQINARIAVDQLRREIHCASSVTPTGASASIAIVLGSRCPFGGGSTVRWCTVGTGSRYALYRSTGATCSSTDKKLINYLTTGSVFTFTAQSTSSLADLSISLPINTNSSTGRPDYRLTDDIVLRNSTRS